ncbi:MAG: pyridoxamine 5'-phosphate oxidase family protein [Lachnospiraceae bacterium]|nr:pyridoxamine 5'-phosphate oxidase family protein [Lachnospiraceae bacterium]
MKKLTKDVEKIMEERFGKDSLIALATTENGVPYVRTVNGYYDSGAFYVLTHELSNKIKQIEKNPVVAISGEWFTAHGTGSSLGWFCRKENELIASKMKTVFAEWIDNGHNNFDDENTCILRIELTDGVLFSHGTRYDIDFTSKY